MLLGSKMLDDIIEPDSDLRAICCRMWPFADMHEASCRPVQSSRP